MKLIFLGTSAGVPTRTRNISAILLDFQYPTFIRIWLFDCGEGTQHQLLRTNYYPGKLEKIFITHLHGDHIFGLPGLLCSRSISGNVNPLVIYGPTGIRTFVETTLRLSGSRTDFPLKVIEINAGQIFEDKHCTVTAWLLNHSIECYGYRVEESSKPGALNATALKEIGINPGPIFKRLKKGEAVILDDGRIIHGINYLSPPLPGKKLAIFGDTAPFHDAQVLARKVDLMVHEATLESLMESKANSRGHSSARQAAQLAKLAEAKRLIVTHISSRYNGERSARLLQECRRIFPASELAEDFTSFKV